MKNIYTQSETTPDQIDGTYPPTREQLLAAGFRDVPPIPAVPDGFTETSLTFGDGDGVTGAWVQVVRPTADLVEEARAAKMATFPAQEAVIFRLTMRRNFGDNAETNRAIGAAEVEAYFVGKQVNGTITVQELADASVLERLFAELKAWNGTDETWTLFENYGGLLP